jgi:putative flippase GtrA
MSNYIMVYMPALSRFIHYGTVGVTTFALDLAMLFLLTDGVGIHYLLSACIAFVLAVSINYCLSRRHVFSQTSRPFASGYAYFFGIALVGLGAIVGLMYVAVDVLGFHYLASRIAVAGAVGIWTYFMNLYLNFRVAGIE